MLTRERIYSKAFKEKGLANVVKWDVFPIHDQEKLHLIFESVSSPWRQGVWMKTDAGLVINSVDCPSIELWTDTAGREITIQCRTNDGLLHVYNIWDSGKGARESQAWTSGMLVEDLENGRRYRCNDIGTETRFDKLIFRIERI